MQDTTIWLAHERVSEARQRADRERVARSAQRLQPTLLRRIRRAP